MADFTDRRVAMVDTQVRPSDVTKYPILDAMLTVERESFVPSARREVAYVEGNVLLSGDRVVLAPRTFAKMLEASDITPEDFILDLGAGLGYSTAILSKMAKAVVGVESDAELATEAETNLAQAGTDNAVILPGELAKGAPMADPYDVIVVNGAIEQWPQDLTDQLREGGRAAAIFQNGALSEVRAGKKLHGRMQWREICTAGAPLLPGFEKTKVFVL